jgi:hypothetical protein
MRHVHQYHIIQSNSWHAHMCTAPQVQQHVGRTLVPPSAVLGRETGLKSLLRARVSALSAHAVTARSLPFGYSSTGDELAFCTFFAESL